MTGDHAAGILHQQALNAAARLGLGLFAYRGILIGCRLRGVGRFYQE
jgi:hypothetical protein